MIKSARAWFKFWSGIYVGTVKKCDNFFVKSNAFEIFLEKSTINFDTYPALSRSNAFFLQGWPTKVIDRTWFQSRKRPFLSLSNRKKPIKRASALLCTLEKLDPSRFGWERKWECQSSGVGWTPRDLWRHSSRIFFSSNSIVIIRLEMRGVTKRIKILRGRKSEGILGVYIRVTQSCDDNRG